MEAGDEPGDGNERKRAGRRRFEDHAEAVEDRLTRGAESEGAVCGGDDAGGIGNLALDRDRRVEDEDQESEGDQREHAVHDALRHVAFRIGRFFRRERKLLDGKKQPHGKGHGGEDAVDPERQEGTVALG